MSNPRRLLSWTSFAVEFWIAIWTGTNRHNLPVNACHFFLVSKFDFEPDAEIRPYMYETLMYLVNVHAQVSRVTEPLLDRTLNALVEDLAEEALRCFRQVKRFGMGGMLRVSFPLPICYIHEKF